MSEAGDFALKAKTRHQGDAIDAKQASKSLERWQFERHLALNSLVRLIVVPEVMAWLYYTLRLGHQKMESKQIQYIMRTFDFCNKATQNGPTILMVGCNRLTPEWPAVCAWKAMPVDPNSRSKWPAGGQGLILWTCCHGSLQCFDLTPR